MKVSAAVSGFYGGGREDFSGQIQVLCLGSCLLSLYVGAGRSEKGRLLSRGAVNTLVPIAPLSASACGGPIATGTNQTTFLLILFKAHVGVLGDCVRVFFFFGFFCTLIIKSPL